jgi:hypothetical protein
MEKIFNQKNFNNFVGTPFVRLPASLFYIERDPHSRTRIGGRDILAVHKNEAMVA